MSAVRDWMTRFAAEIAANREELTRLDAAIGDADHGTNMDRGMRKVIERLEALDDDDAAAELKAVGIALVSSVGGAAGPLYGTFFLEMGKAATGGDWVAAIPAGVDGVKARGKAQAGDKTMLDALIPAAEALREGGTLQDAAAAAQEGMKATTPMVARKGRASYLGERSAGHQDPGATSSHLLIKSAAD